MNGDRLSIGILIVFGADLDSSLAFWIHELMEK
jgi:hypothetical protein